MRKNQHIEVPAWKFEELSAAYCADKIAQENKAKRVTHQGTDYAVIAGASGAVEGSLIHKQTGGRPYVEAVEITPETIYQGDLKPLWYGEHFRAVDNGDRPRGYDGMRVRIKDRNWVVVPGTRVRFLPTQEGTQGGLF